MTTTEPRNEVVLSRLTPMESRIARVEGVELEMTPMGLAWHLPPSLSQKVHMLIPSGSLVQVDPNYKPLLATVQLKEDVHTYAEKSAPKVGGDHQRALNAKGLAQIAKAAGIKFKAPLVDYMGGAGVAYTAIAEGRGPDGTPEEDTATKAVRFADLKRKARRERRATIEKDAAGGDNVPGWAQKKAKALLDNPEALEAELEKYVDEQMEHIDAKTETKAKNRVLRHWLAIESTYPAGSIDAKPFLVCRWVFTPDYSNPHVAQIIDAQFGRADRALYGAPLSGRPQLESGHRFEEEPPVDDDGAEEIVEEVEIVEVVPNGDDDKPPKPENLIEFKSGPYEGQRIDAVLEDEAGRRYVADTAAHIKTDSARQVLLDWLSYAEGRVIRAEDCAELAKRVSDDDGIPF